MKNQYREAIKKLIDRCENERDLWLIWRFVAGRVKDE